MYTELVRQVPSVAVGAFVFVAYQKLVGKLVEVMQASTGAVTANTAALLALKEAIERGMERAEQRHQALMTKIGKMHHDIINFENLRRGRPVTQWDPET